MKIDREILSHCIHETWCTWMKYMFHKSILNADGTVTIPRWAVERWKRQAYTVYANLSEQEKTSDRIEADKILSFTRGIHGNKL